MTRSIGQRKRDALIHDLIHADFDLTTLRSKYHLSPDSLAQWVQEDENRRCLTGLCVLADIQTQLLLSRYRLIAAGRLIDMATHPPDDGKSGLDIARRACVDLLKLELPRAVADARQQAPDTAKIPDDGLASLQNLIRGADAPDALTDASPEDEHTDSPDA